MKKINLTKAEKLVLWMIQERKFEELGRFLELHNFDSGLIQAVKNFGFWE